LNIGDHRTGIGCRANQQVFRKGACLPEREIDFRLRLLRQIAGAAVGHDADNFRRRLLTSESATPSSRFGLLPGKYRSARARLTMVTFWRIALVRVAKVPPLRDRHAKNVEVTRV
jgi:hypothetical protein